MTLYHFKQLLRESEWMRVYRIGPKDLLYESKFLIDGLEVSSSAIKSRWQQLTAEEQLDFAQGFSAKRHLSASDHDILSFLMEHGSDEICGTIATRLPEHPDRERTVNFLLDRAARGGIMAPNYYQALEVINDMRAVPVLREIYLRYRERGAEVAISSLPARQANDYLDCARALAKLTGSAEYAAAVDEMQQHSDDTVNWRARLLSSDLRK